MSSHVSVPIPTPLFLKLVGFLRENNSPADPVELVEAAVDYWLDNAAWKPDLLPASPSPDGAGCMWKEVFLPPGTRLRIRAKGDFAYAEVREDKIFFGEQSVSPSEFANRATGTTRNAWRDVWVKRPDDTEWKLADELRNRGSAPDSRASVPDQNRMAALTDLLELDVSDLLAAADLKITYRDDIKVALEQLGGKAHRQRVIDSVRKIRAGRGATIPRTFDETVQQAFERHCVDSDIFCGREEYALFSWPHGKHDGTWALNR